MGASNDSAEEASLRIKLEHFSEIRSSKSTRRLKQIAELRARGIGNHVGLPQQVVCGDQSTGKSSVLEGLTGIPFPRQEGVCTKFPTEIILQDSPGGLQIVATIIPASSRSEKERASMSQYRKELGTFDELPIAIAEAGQLMGIKGFGGIQVGPAFAEDILRIEVTGPTGIHTSYIDLPGLIEHPNENQTDRDVAIVRNLVNSYAGNPRTIILAVIQAGNDIANQSIIKIARRNDPKGERTVGIITKPDLINEGTENRIALLAKNQDTTKLRLGFFLVKNPTPMEIERGITPEEREQKEMLFFTSPVWREQNLDPQRLGTASLRRYLPNLLDQTIELQLPEVRSEIEKLQAKTHREMMELGEARLKGLDCRLYLSRLALHFHNLTTSALNGTYHETDARFFATQNLEGSTRLRALLHTWNKQFSDNLRDHGEKRKIVGRLAEIELDSGGQEEEDGSEEDATEADHEGRNDGSDHSTASCVDNPQICLLRSGMKDWVREIYSITRGKELPGNYNHLLLSELFCIQSSRWKRIAEEHLEKVIAGIEEFTYDALAHLVKDDLVRQNLNDIVRATLQAQRKRAEGELQQLVEDEKGHPITYNHYYTDNIQKSRRDAARKLFEKVMLETKKIDFNGKMHISNTSSDVNELISYMQNRVNIDMDDQACEEALQGLKAYYTVARKSFVDNVCRQVIERHLVRSLPRIFGPDTVAEMGEEELERIAAEKPTTTMKRRELTELHLQLSNSLLDLCR